MASELKEMFEILIGKFDEVNKRFDEVNKRFDKVDDRLDKLESRMDKLESRMDNIELEFREFKVEMKEQIKGLDGKVDMIYNKLTSDIEEIKNRPEPKFKIVREA